MDYQNSIMQFFEHGRFAPGLKRIADPVARLATLVSEICPASAETTAGLRKLLEARDCFMRSLLIPDATGLDLPGTADSDVNVFDPGPAWLRS